MKGIGRAAAALTVLLPLAGAPVAAQSWRADLGVNGGGSWYSPLLGSNQMNNANGNVRFKAGWLTGAQATFWVMPRIGIRANGTYTDRPLKQGNSFMGTDNTLYNDVNLWSGTGDLMLRFRRPADTWTRLEALPYLALGLGAKWITPAGSGNFAMNNAGATTAGVPFACGSNGTCGGPGTPFSTFGLTAGATGFNNRVGFTSNVNEGTVDNFFLAKSRVLMGLAGLGTDLRLARNFGLRLEVGDRIYKPKVYATNAALTATTGDNIAKTVHEVYAQAGLHMLFGLAAPPVVAVTPAPAPAPAPEPPPPAPAPATQNLNVCALDPTAPTGLRTLTAVYNPATNDTTVLVNGNNVPLNQAVTGVPVASSASWYTQGQPLMLGTGRNALSYVSFGSARNIDMGDLAFVGTINGLPVYANRSDVANLTIPRPAVDISTNPALITGLRNVQVLYVPLTTTGCNFQPIQLQQQVRKGRG